MITCVQRTHKRFLPALSAVDSQIPLLISVKDKIANILALVDHMVSVSAVQTLLLLHGRSLRQSVNEQAKLCSNAAFFLFVFTKSSGHGPDLVCRPQFANSCLKSIHIQHV